MSSLRDRILASEKATPSNHFDGPAPEFHVDTQPRFHAAATAIPGAAETIRGFLREYRHATGLVRGLRSWLRYQQTRNELAALGFPITDAEGFHFENSDATEAEKANVEQRLGRCIRARLESQVSALSVQACQSVLDELAADRATLATADSITAKYRAPCSPLAAGLDNAIARLRAEIGRPMDLSWHYSMEIALGQIFGGGFTEAAKVAADVTAPDATAVGTAKTAVEIATARAA